MVLTAVIAGAVVMAMESAMEAAMEAAAVVVVGAIIADPTTMVAVTATIGTGLAAPRLGMVKAR